MTEWVQLLNEPGCDNYGRLPRSLPLRKDAHEFCVLCIFAYGDNYFYLRPFDDQDI